MSLRGSDGQQNWSSWIIGPGETPSAKVIVIYCTNQSNILFKSDSLKTNVVTDILRTINMQEKIHPFWSLDCDCQRAIVPGYLIIHPETKNRIRTLHGLLIMKRENHDSDGLFGTKAVRHESTNSVLRENQIFPTWRSSTESTWLNISISPVSSLYTYAALFTYNWKTM